MFTVLIPVQFSTRDFPHDRSISLEVLPFHSEAVLNAAWKVRGHFVSKTTVVIKHRYNPDPRLSATQMAQYMNAGADRRYVILQEAKFPRSFMFRYTDAVNPVTNYFLGKEDALEHGILKLKMKASAEELKDFTRETYQLCIDAIESFRGTKTNLDIGKVIFKRTDLSEMKMDIKGVELSVLPHLMTEEVKRGGKRSTGAAILSFSKSKSVPELEATAMVIYRYLKAHPTLGALCSPELCMAIDVPNATAYRAGTAQVRFWRNVEASCSEVRRIWPTVEPPKNYNGPPIIPRAA
jgi:hypothetical protein